MKTFRSLLCLSVLLLLAVTAYAGTAYTGATSYGAAVPGANTPAFQDFCKQLINFRLNECPLTHPGQTVYYISSFTGSDSNNGLTTSTPFATIAKADAVEEASSGNVALAFECGSRFQSNKHTYNYTLASSHPAQAGANGSGQAIIAYTPANQAAFPYPGDSMTVYTGANQTGTPQTLQVQSLAFSANGDTNVYITFSAPLSAAALSVSWSGLDTICVTQPNVVIESYVGTHGTAAPIFSAFIPLANDLTQGTSTAATGYTMTRQQANTIDVAYFRERDNNALIYRKMPTVDLVDQNQECWAQTGGNLYWRSPNDYNWYMEYVPSNDCTAIYIADVDGTRIDGIDVEGYSAKSADYSGLNAVAANIVGYGIKGAVNGTHAAVVSNSTVYVSDKHNLGILGATSGGIVTYYHDRAGWNTFGDTAYVAYTAYGGNECVLANCEYLGTSIPMGVQALGGAGFYMHSGGPTSFTYTAAAGQTSLTVNPLGSANVQIFPGETIQLTNHTVGYNGTGFVNVVVSSYNPSTGVVTFPSTTLTAGADRLYYAASTGLGAADVGTTVNYNNALMLQYNNKIFPHKYNNQASFGSSGFPLRSQTLAGYRNWIVGERGDVRTPSEFDRNMQSFAVTSINGTGNKTVTLSAALTTVIPNFNYYNVQGFPCILTGGTSGPERNQASINGAGTVVTLSNTPAATDHNAITLTLGGNVSGSTNIGSIGMGSYTVDINSQYNARTVMVSNNTQGPQALYPNAAQVPGISSVNINDTYVLDFAAAGNVGAGSAPRTLFAVGGTQTLPYFDHCLFDFKVDTGDRAGIEQYAVNGTGASQATVINSIIAGDGGGTIVPGIGNVAGRQANNAYQGIDASGITGVGGYSNDPYAVPLPESGSWSFSLISSGNPLVSINEQPLVLGGINNSIQVDQNNALRYSSSPAIGPLEPTPGLNNSNIGPVQVKRNRS